MLIITKKGECMEYLESLAWLALWPIVLYLGYRFSIKNSLKGVEK